MNEAADPLYWPVYVAVIAIWLAYAAAFLARRRRQESKQREQKNRSLGGIAVVGLGFMLAWTIRRPATAPLLPTARYLSFAIELLAVPIGIASVWLTVMSIRTLGKQWNLRAALVAGHALVTNGPYGRVRHPLYLGMLGLMFSTAVANATWWGLLLTMAAGVAGTLIRIHYEERLLREAFGADFLAYRARIPGLLPRPFARNPSRYHAHSSRS